MRIGFGGHTALVRFLSTNFTIGFLGVLAFHAGEALAFNTKFVAGKDMGRYCDAVFPTNASDADAIRGEMREKFMKDLKWAYERVYGPNSMEGKNFPEIKKEWEKLVSDAKDKLARATDSRKGLVEVIKAKDQMLTESGEKPLNIALRNADEDHYFEGSKNYSSAKEREKRLNDIMGEIEYRAKSSSRDERYNILDERGYPYSAGYPSALYKLYSELKDAGFHKPSDKDSDDVKEFKKRLEEFDAGAKSLNAGLPPNTYKAQIAIEPGVFREAFFDRETHKELKQYEFTSQRKLFEIYQKLSKTINRDVIEKLLKRFPQYSEARDEVNGAVKAYSVVNKEVGLMEEVVKYLPGYGKDLEAISERLSFNSRMLDCNASCSRVAKDAAYLKPGELAHTNMRITPAAVDIHYGVVTGFQNSELSWSKDPEVKAAGVAATKLHDACWEKPSSWLFKSTMEARALKPGATGGALVKDIEERGRDTQDDYREFVKSLGPKKLMVDALDSQAPFGAQEGQQHDSEKPKGRTAHSGGAKLRPVAVTPPATPPSVPAVATPPLAMPNGGNPTAPTSPMTPPANPNGNPVTTQASMAPVGLPQAPAAEPKPQKFSAKEKSDFRQAIGAKEPHWLSSPDKGLLAEFPDLVGQRFYVNGLASDGGYAERIYVGGEKKWMTTTEYAASRR